MIGNTLAIFFDSPLPIKYLCSLEQKEIPNLTLTLTLTGWVLGMGLGLGFCVKVPTICWMYCIPLM